MWARIENNIVVETTEEDPNGRFHESLKWEVCVDEAEIGWSYNNGELSAQLESAEPTLDQIRANRLAAYRAESDRIKIEAEYDAILAESLPDYSEWLAKVAEIKARYPIPAQ